MSLSTPSTPTPPTLPNASICHNLSLFKSHLLLSRSYDDSIVLRLNRSEALSGRAVQGRDRISSKASECEKFWSELHGVWEGRNRVLELCANGPAEVVAAAVPVSKGKREKGGRIEDRLSMDRDNGSGKKASTIVGRGETEAEVVVSPIQANSDCPVWRYAHEDDMMYHSLTTARFALTEATDPNRNPRFVSSLSALNTH